MRTAPFKLLLFSFGLLGPIAWAAPITTDTALPINKGEFLWREQVRFLKAEDSTRDLEVIAMPSVFVYGVTEKFALIGMVPYLDMTLKMGGAERGGNGLGDSTLLGRYEVFHLDRPGETFRAQILGGLKFPTGEDGAHDSLGRLPPPLQLGSGSYDPIVAGVFTWQRLRWQADFDAAYKVNTEANSFRFGNTLSHDVAWEYRLWPWQLPERGVPGFVYGVVELNGVWAERSELTGRKIGDSGGYTLFISPGLQYAAKRWVAEISVQLPVVQDLNGVQLKTDFILIAGFRIQF